MALTPGTRLGSYEVVAQIGVGGMGEGYRATDTKLKRQIALKTCRSPSAPASILSAIGVGLTQRFAREAKTPATLSHLHRQVSSALGPPPSATP